MIPQSHIAKLSPYALARMTAPVGKRLISLAQNEALRPPSPRATAAAQEALASAALYPDPDWTDLRDALSARHNLPMQGLLCGAGSLDLIGALARVYTGPKRAMLIPAHAYPFFRSAAHLAGARVDTAPETNGHVDVDALLAAVRPDTGLVCVANPANPTGTSLPDAEITRLRDGLRDDILLLVDEAYGEFVPEGSTSFDLITRGNTAVTRTFSKAYGLAGLRVGWGSFPDAVAGELRKVLNPNNVTAPSQAAALAALQDVDYMQETVAQTAALRAEVTGALTDAGLSILPSRTNFVALDLGSAEAVASLDAHLQAQGIFLRPQSGAGLPHVLRMTLGPPEDVALAQAEILRWAREWRAREALR